MTNGMDGLGMTSRWVAALRERETLRPDRLFDDPFAGYLAGDDGRKMCEVMESDLPAMAGNRGLAVRTRFLDDLVKTAVDCGLRQVVIIAAGMDTRAYRLKWPSDTVIYEVERQEVLAYKDALLANLDAMPQAERRTVAIDLRDDFATALRDAGFVPTEPALFLVEGLLAYLPDQSAALRVLRIAAELAAPGSRIGMDVVGSSFLALPFLTPLLQRLEALGAPWLFGTDDPRPMLHEAGFSDVDVIASRQVPFNPARLTAAAYSGTSLTGDYYFMVTARRPSRDDGFAPTVGVSPV